MKKTIVSIALCSFLSTSMAFAADTGKVELRVSIDDGTTTVMDSGKNTKTFTADVRQMQSVVLSSSAPTVISVPTSADAVMFDIGSIRGLHLTGVAGDKGISLDNVCPILLPLSNDNVTITISNDYAASPTIKIYWL